MKLNSLHPGEGAKKVARRVGRGIGSGLGKTCGRGHKGLTSRTGGTVAPGFEGGQTPLHRRLPKFGFSSLKARYVAEVRLHELALVDGDVVDLDALKNANLVRRDVLSAKVVLSGALDKSVTVKGLRVTKGARAAIEAAGGKIED